MRAEAGHGSVALVLGAGEASTAHLDAVHTAARAWSEAAPALARVPGRVSMALGAEGEAALTVLLRWAGSLLRFFVVAWWMARGAMRRALATAKAARSSAGSSMAAQPRRAAGSASGRARSSSRPS